MQDNVAAGSSADAKIHHEDIEIGRPVTFGHKVVTKEEIIAFGRAFDPQPMHTDEAAARTARLVACARPVGTPAPS